MQTSFSNRGEGGEVNELAFAIQQREKQLGK